MQSNAEQGKSALSADTFVNVSAGGYDGQPPPPSYTSQSAPAAYMAQPAAHAYAVGAPYGVPQHGAYAQYGGAPTAVGFAQPVGTQNVQVNMVGATAPPPQTIIVAQSTTTVVAPPSYLGWSIFNLLCCFLPLGLAALIFSIKVGSARTPDEARSYSLTARNLNIAATVIAPVLVVIIVGVYFGLAAATVVRAVNTYSSSYSYSYSCYYYNSYYKMYSYTCR